MRVAPSGPPRKSAKVEPEPSQNPDPLHCSFYVSRKHRFCRTECRPGSRYCCTHDVAPAGSAAPDQSSTKNAEEVLPSTSAESGVAGGGVDGDVSSRTGAKAEARVPCPINPNHTVYASRLAHHVKVCPDLRFVTTQLPYFSADKHANRGTVFVPAAAAGDSKRRTHRDLSAEDLAALIQKVETCYRTCVGGEIVVLPSSTTTLTAAAAEAAASDASSAPAVRTSSSPPPPQPFSHAESASQKHGPQHTALLRCLSDVILQSTAPDSILAHYADLSSAKGGDDAQANPIALAGAEPIYTDGFLEFGAGKGGLSVALQQLIVQHLPASATAHKDDSALDGAPTSTVTAEAEVEVSTTLWPFLKEVAARPPLVVLDMDGFRRKGDARVKHSAVPLQRLRINIKDVDLTRAFLTDIRPVKTTELAAAAAAAEEGAGRSVQNWAVLGKHLCGACTDFALSCLTEAPALYQSAQVRLPVVVIATCCHHRCELVHLNPPEQQTSAAVEEGGPAVLRMPGSALTWSSDEFAALTSMTSWAVCGGFVDETRRVVGWQCKRILDQLRVHFLRQLGYVAFQCQYTKRDVTEENVCIVAFQRPA